jgi:splicing factor 3A subunit 1
MFGTDTEEDLRKRQEDEERQKRKEREKIIWDGHTASKVATVEKFQTGSNLDLQIEAIHRAKGLSAYVSLLSYILTPSPEPLELTEDICLVLQRRQRRRSDRRSWTFRLPSTSSSFLNS